MLADEPTAALDGANGHAVMALLARIAKEQHRSVLAGYADPRTLSYADRVVRIEDGRIVGEERRPEGLDARKLQILQKRRRPCLRSTHSLTLGIAGILAISVGFYVNSVSWGRSPRRRHAGNASTTAPSRRRHRRRRRSADLGRLGTGRVEPKSGEVRITAEVGGRIVEVAAGLNDPREEGDLPLLTTRRAHQVAGAHAEAQVRVRERNEEDAPASARASQC